MNTKKYPWPCEFYKNTSYLYPWYTHLFPTKRKLRNLIKKPKEAES